MSEGRGDPEAGEGFRSADDQLRGAALDALCDALFYGEASADGPVGSAPAAATSAATCVAPIFTRPARCLDRQSLEREDELEETQAMLTQPQELPRSAKTKPTRRRSVFGAAWLTGFVLLAAWLGFGSPRLPWSSGRPSAPASVASSASPRTKPIEEIQLGDRVLGRNPLREQVDESLPEPEAATWRCLKLRLQKQDGLTLWVHLLRPLSWIEASGAKPGGTFYLDLPEMGAVGDAQVESIGPCPPIKPGKGSVVTGRFIHETNGRNVVSLSLDGQPEPTRVTKDHPYWSDDRNDFVPAGELRSNEHVVTLAGIARVVSVRPVEHSGLLYNLESHREHVFMVGSLGSIVHNTCPGQHHFIPVALGNRIPYGSNSLSRFGGANHTRVQTALNTFLSGEGKMVNGKWVDMLARRGNAGSVVRANFSPAERLDAMERFYRGFENGRYYPAYRMELNVLMGLGGLF